MARNTLLFVRQDPSWPKGHDVADLIAAGWDEDRLLAYMRDNRLTFEQFAPLVKPSSEPRPGASFSPSNEGQKQEPSGNGRLPQKAHGYYRPLGYNHGTYYVLCHQSQQVHDFTPGNAKNELRGIAPLSYWQSNYMTQKGGVDWDSAIDTVIGECYAAGIYKPGQVRGRGVWFDDNRVVLHLGDHLIVDGHEAWPSDIHSKHIYPVDSPLGFRLVEPMSDEQAYRIYGTANEFLWERGIYGALFAGWLAIAPLCGALPWRPHLWLTGGAGSGKSSLEREFMVPMLAGFALSIQGGSTEAGIRQTLRSDALPVIFDEAADSENLSDSMRARINSIMDLTRSSSTQNSGALVKGTTSHKALTFELNSAFCLSSVLVPNMNDADASRFTVLRLRALTDEERESNPHQWGRLLSKLKGVRDWGPAFVSRNLRLLPSILENISVFSALCAEKLRSQRLGDQYGTMLAAAYSMLPDAVRANPEVWVSELDWEEYQADPGSRDEFKCLNAIVEHVLTVRHEDKPLSHERSISALIRTAAEFEDVADEHVRPGLARAVLARHGMAVVRARDIVDPYLFVAATHRSIRDILRSTRWASGWTQSLRRIKGAIGTDVQKLEGRPTRGVSIPISAFLDPMDVTCVTEAQKDAPNQKTIF